MARHARAPLGRRPSGPGIAIEVMSVVGVGWLTELVLVWWMRPRVPVPAPRCFESFLDIRRILCVWHACTSQRSRNGAQSQKVIKINNSIVNRQQHQHRTVIINIMTV